jgi:hypothetical protein
MAFLIGVIISTPAIMILIFNLSALWLFAYVIMIPVVLGTILNYRDLQNKIK